jgi:hypothetical protein
VPDGRFMRLTKELYGTDVGGTRRFVACSNA